MGAFDGNGTFVRSYNWVQDKANSIDITASRMDTEDSGFAAGLSNCLTRDGQGRMAADFVPAADLNSQLGTASLRWSGFNGKSADHILPQTAIKALTTPRTAGIVPAADPDLILPVSATGTYALKIYLGVSTVSTIAQGFRFSVFAGGTTFSFVTPGLRATWSTPISGGILGGAAIFTTTPTVVFNSMSDTGLTAGQTVLIEGSFIANSLANAFVQLYWAQNSSSSNATSVLAGSYMTLTRID